jgi:cell division septation protein DedD
MRNNETGEFELVVGNRQILSGFFIVVLLFAVGVAMGYFLGQNTPRSAKLTEAAAASPPPDARPQAAAPVQPAAPAPTPVETAPATAPAPGEPGPQPTTQAVREPGVSAPAPAPAAAAAPATVAEAAPGTYWQVMAVGRSDAVPVLRTLHDFGFPATLSPGIKGLTRVLAGPYADRSALGRAKSELEAKGFFNLYKVEITGADRE